MSKLLNVVLFVAAMLVVVTLVGSAYSTGYGDGYLKGMTKRPPQVLTACVPPSKQVRVLMTSVPAGAVCNATLQQAEP